MDNPVVECSKYENSDGSLKQWLYLDSKGYEVHIWCTGFTDTSVTRVSPQVACNIRNLHKDNKPY